MKSPPPFKSAQHGVVLIEAMIAILIFSVGVLGIVGMQAAMIKNASDSKYRADAAYVAQRYIGETWANNSVLPAVPDISGLLPNGVLNAGVSNVTPIGFQLTVTVRWQQPGEDARHTYTTIASIATKF